jgi:microcystin-dependent protein
MTSLSFLNLNPNNAKAYLNHFESYKTRLCPPGTVLNYASSSAPSGWLLCDGSAVSRSLYNALFNIISTTYGIGDGATTFNLPDMRGRSILGFGEGAGLTNRVMGANGGAETHTLTVDEMPAHNHGVTDPGHNHGITDPGHNHTYVNNVNDQNTDNAFATETAADELDINHVTGTSTTGITVNNKTTGITTNNTGGGNAHNNMSPFLVLNHIIKY